MPDKQNESKFMAMLERRGIVRNRSADSEEGSGETNPGDVRARHEADLRSRLGPPNGDAVKATPAARQPVPGMINPIMPGERPRQVERDQPRPAMPMEPTHPQPAMRTEPAPPQQPVRRAEPMQPQPQPQPMMRTEPVQPQPVRRAEPVQPQPQPQPIMRPEPVQPQPVMRPEPAPPKRVEMQQPTPFFSGVDPFSDDTAPAKQPAVAPIVYEKPPEPPPIESYTDRYLDIDELYGALSLKSQRTDTIYLIEEYLRTLPESLPDESRRDIVNKIVAASGFDFDLLMGDGVLRVKMLKDYAEKFARHTDNYVSARNAELDDLEQQMMRIRRQIENRKELHKKQFLAIEAEAQRLKDILIFING